MSQTQMLCSIKMNLYIIELNIELSVNILMNYVFYVNKLYAIFKKCISGK